MASYQHRPKTKQHSAKISSKNIAKPRIRTISNTKPNSRRQKRTFSINNQPHSSPSAKFQHHYMRSAVASTTQDAPEPEFTTTVPNVDEFSYDKSIPPTEKLFQYLEKYGRNNHPAVTALRLDTLIHRQRIIGMLLEPTTCSLVDWQVKALGASRILEIGTFTGVTAMSLALGAQQNDLRLRSTEGIRNNNHRTDWNWLHGLVGEQTVGNPTQGSVRANQTGIRQFYTQNAEKMIIKQRRAEQGIEKGKNDPTSLHLDLSTVTEKEVIVHDHALVFDTLVQNIEKWDSIVKFDSSEAYNPAQYSPPLVITIDRNTSNIHDVSYHHWSKAQLIGSPLVFLGGMATDVLNRMTGLPLPPTPSRGDDQHNKTPSTEPPTAAHEQYYGHLFRNSFDFIFVDADKRSYPGYFERCLELLKPGTGVMCFDNVLWKGEVLSFAPDRNDGYSQSFQNCDNQTSVTTTTSLDTELTQVKNKQQKPDLSSELHEFNMAVHRDPRVEIVLLPIGDGITMMRKL